MGLMVKVTHGSEEMQLQGQSYILVEKEVTPNSLVSFGEQTYDMGSWRAIAPVRTIHVQGGGGGGGGADNQDMVVTQEVNPDRLIAQQTFHIVQRNKNGDDALAVELGEAK